MTETGFFILRIGTGGPERTTPEPDGEGEGEVEVRETSSCYKVGV